MKQNDENANQASPDLPAAEIEIIHRVNRLKKKVSHGRAGTGFIDPEAIKRAKKVIAETEHAYLDEVKALLPELNKRWEELKKAPSSQRTEHLEELSRCANRMKDMASTYKYDLMAYFSESLRDFTEVFDFDNEAHHTIMQAHIDVIWIVHSENLKEEIGEKAEELKTFVEQAIKKYS